MCYIQTVQLQVRRKIYNHKISIYQQIVSLNYINNGKIKHPNNTQTIKFKKKIAININSVLIKIYIC